MNTAKRLSSGAVGLSLLALSLVVVGGTAPVTAAPGNPGVPSDPRVVFVEDFEAPQTIPGVDWTTQAVSLDEYVGAQGVGYTADPYWVNAEQCNGIILTANKRDNAAGTPLAECEDGSPRDRLELYAQKLGEYRGLSVAEAADNHAISAYTRSQGSGGQLTTLETAAPVNVGTLSNRFLTVASDVAVTACNGASPNLQYVLKDGAEETVVGGASACGAISGDSNLGEANSRLGTIFGSESLLFSGTDLGLEVRNLEQSGGGNDYGYDNVRILDATPQLDKEFANVPEPLYTGVDEFDLVLTVTNTSELAAKDGWSFTDSLDGLEVGPSGLQDGSTCDATVVAESGSDSIAVTEGALAAGEVSCTLTVGVVATGDGEISNGPDNIDAAGLDAPGTASVQAIAPDPQLEIEKIDELVDTNGNGVADAGEQINYTFVVSNTGNVPVSEIVVNDDRVTGLAPQDFALEPGDDETVTADPYTVTEEDVAAGGVANTASASGVDPWGNAVESAEVEVVTPVATPEPPVEPAPPAQPEAPEEQGILPAAGSMFDLWMGAAALLLVLAGAALALRRRSDTGSH